MDDAILLHICECDRCLTAALTRRGPLFEHGCETYQRLAAGTKVIQDLQMSIQSSQGHLTEDTLEEHYFDRLPPGDKVRVKLHLAQCPRCTARLEHQREFVMCLKEALRDWMDPRVTLRRSQKTARPPRFSAAQIAAAREKLPISRVAGMEALRILQNENGSLSDVERVVQSDPILAAHLIRVANSAMLSFGHEARTVGHAVARIGFEKAKLHIWALSMKSMFLSPLLQRVWNHSTMAAHVARALAGMTRAIAPEEACLAGLVHDIGQVVFASIGTEYAKAYRARSASGAPMVEIERELCGATHAEVGADLLREWRFADEMVEAVRFHHAPTPSSPISNLLFVAEHWLNGNEDLCDLETHRSCMRRLGLVARDLESADENCSADLEILRFVA